MLMAQAPLQRASSQCTWVCEGESERAEEREERACKSVRQAAGACV